MNSAKKSIAKKQAASRLAPNVGEPLWVRAVLITFAVTFLTLFLLLPLIIVFVKAFSDGIGAYFAAIVDPFTAAALRLTLLTAAIAVTLNTLFGIAAAWCLSKFQFWGKSVLLTLIDLPFAVSPVIAGMLFLILFGTQSSLGLWLRDHNIRIIFAVPGVIIATLFVTFPFVVRELLPIMQTQGTEEEQAARMLGARGWHIFWRVTLPNIKWGLLYGAILCNARAMGEFGAVAVVSGRFRGETNTLSLHIEALYQEFSTGIAPPFAVASILAMLAIVTLVIKAVIEIKTAETEE